MISPQNCFTVSINNEDAGKLTLWKESELRKLFIY